MAKRRVSLKKLVNITELSQQKKDALAGELLAMLSGDDFHLLYSGLVKLAQDDAFEFDDRSGMILTTMLSVVNGKLPIDEFKESLGYKSDTEQLKKDKRDAVKRELAPRLFYHEHAITISQYGECVGNPGLIFELLPERAQQLYDEIYENSVMESYGPGTFLRVNIPGWRDLPGEGTSYNVSETDVIDTTELGTDTTDIQQVYQPEPEESKPNGMVKLNYIHTSAELLSWRSEKQYIFRPGFSEYMTIDEANALISARPYHFQIGGSNE